jgi:hypothetical protein
MSLPASWGWFGFSMIVLSVVLFATWALAQFFDWIFPGYGGKILFACLLLFPIGVALFATSDAFEAAFNRDEES